MNYSESRKVLLSDMIGNVLINAPFAKIMYIKNNYFSFSVYKCFLNNRSKYIFRK